MKIAIIGAGSTYTPELIEGFLQNNQLLRIEELCLMDIDRRKGEIICNFVRRMVEHREAGFAVTFTEDLDTALTGADFVLAQIRVGRLSARILDEKIPLQYGLIGQETTGIGGFFKALRTVPVIYELAKRMEELCPSAWLINFSNPSGILAEMILNYTSIRSMGLCNVPINMMIDIRKKLELPNAQVGYLGLNHLSWVTSIQDGGKEYIGEALDRGITGVNMKNITQSHFDYEVVRTVGAIPCSYLEYFYFRNSKLEKMLSEEKSRGEQCKDLEEELLELYCQEELVEKPAILDQRGGHRYSEAAVNLICAIHGDRDETHVVNVKNQGVLPFMADDDVVEIPAVIGKNGASPQIVANWDNPHIRVMMQSVKAYEKLAVRAALEGSDRLALSALMIHPLLGDFEAVKACYYKLQEAHRQYLPRFFAE